MKVFFYGVQEPEKNIFEKENQEYGFELNYTNNLLNHDNINELPEGTDAVVLFVNCKADAESLKYFKDHGVKYVVTRTVGTDHIDLPTATDLGYKIGRVPAYSPTAVASLGFAGGLDLLRKSSLMFYQSANGKFKVIPEMFARELKHSTIGIIGTGKIGFDTAKYWHNAGAKVIGYDLYPNEHAKEVLEYTDLENLIKSSDLISLHIPYIKGENEHFVNEEFLNKMKPGASLVNVSRAPLIDIKAVTKAIKSNHLYGYSADVFDNEADLINNDVTLEELQTINHDLVELLKLYPRVLISPHVAYFTDEAVKNMAETTYKNLKQLIETGTCDTVVN